MANKFNNPIVLDGTMAQDFWTTIGVPAGQGKPLLVDKIRWINPGSAGTGSFLITDASSAANELAAGNAPAASANVDQEILYEYPKPWRNFQLTTFTGGGKIEIHYH